MLGGGVFLSDLTPQDVKKLNFGHCRFVNHQQPGFTDEGRHTVGLQTTYFVYLGNRDS
jgi:hypothetical protein